MTLSRSQWGATYDATIRPPMNLPAPDLWVHHTVTVPTANPAADMRTIENIDIARFGYPSYSWVIHPSGVVLEGMGTRIGAHTYHHNSTSFGVAFIGNFENDQPTPAALDAFVALCRDLIVKGWLEPGAPTGGHRDVYPTACPGANLYPLIPDLRARVAATTTPEEDMPLTDADFEKFFLHAVHAGNVALRQSWGVDQDASPAAFQMIVVDKILDAAKERFGLTEAGGG